MTVKKVHVKQVDANVAQIRANKEMQASTSRHLGTNSMMSSRTGGNATDYGGDGGVGAGAMPARVIAALDILDKAVLGALAGNEDVQGALDSRKPAIVAFADLVLSNPDLSEELVGRVLREVAAKSDAVADASLSSPREFWKVASVFQLLVSKLPVEAPAFQTITEVFCALGDALVSRVRPMPLGSVCLVSWRLADVWCALSRMQLLRRRCLPTSPWAPCVP